MAVAEILKRPAGLAMALALGAVPGCAANHIVLDPGDPEVRVYVEESLIGNGRVDYRGHGKLTFGKQKISVRVGRDGQRSKKYAVYPEYDPLAATPLALLVGGTGALMLGAGLIIPTSVAGIEAIGTGGLLVLLTIPMMATSHAYRDYYLLTSLAEDPDD